MAPPAVNGHRVPSWLSHYDSLVVEAGHLNEVEFIAVPGLLQTAAYAEVVERAGEQILTDDQVMGRVDARLARQDVLHRNANPLHLVSLLAEGVLSSPIGGGAVMADQLDHIIEAAQQPNIEVRIIDPNRAPSAISGFELLTRPGDVDPFMVVTGAIDGAQYVDADDRIAKYVSRFGHLRDTALSPSETIRRIRDIRKTHE
jgi:hypothetical protein